MKRETLIKHLEKHINHPERIDDNVLDFWCNLIKKPSDLIIQVTDIGDDVPVWKCIQQQGELVSLMKSLGVWQRVDELWNRQSVICQTK